MISNEDSKNLQSGNKSFFFFETNKFDKDNYRSYYFADPIKIIRLDRPECLPDFFNELSESAKKYYLAGFFSYELGYLLEPALAYKTSGSFPFAYFCAYENPAIYDHKKQKFISGNFELPREDGEYNISDLRLNVSEDDYKKDIETIRAYIRKGDIYQANYTIRYKFGFSGSPYKLYCDLKEKQYTAYNVYGAFDDYHIISLTPELFYRKTGDKIAVKPMKGTWGRGRNNSEDRYNFEIFSNDIKNQSENVMIVDLLRNDIGKVSVGGSVHVTRLYEIEKYNTLFQMTSTVESVLEENLPLNDLIRSIFPSGSITGAPKIRCMEIIKELEKNERRLYTGSLGFFEPNGNSVFNVAIRTIILQNNEGEMGVGGGIVYDSTPDGEFDECKLKANFLALKAKPAFSIIETILYDKDYEFSDLHLNRMQESAEYFDYAFNRDLLESELDKLKKELSDDIYKIRILLNRFGGLEITHSKTEFLDNNKIMLHEKRTDSSDVFLFHKTTNREFYNTEFAKARELGFFDAVFLNEKNELTEGCITNVYVKQDGRIYTPPLECGLLNGIIRQNLIAEGKVREKKIGPDDIKNAEEIYISNSIAGFKKAVLS
ncbi:MAG: aminodeoxychorismate synthase component I [Spirochaetes bacterium]|nr:aminodeoxychorismate synthase component I [Spirochaetota bacterium]